MLVAYCNILDRMIVDPNTRRNQHKPGNEDDHNIDLEHVDLSRYGGSSSNLEKDHDAL